MMVVGLHLSARSLPLDGTPAESQPVDSETLQPVSFAELLKARERQLQQEQVVGAMSIAAALAAMQIPIVTLAPETTTGSETNAPPALMQDRQTAVIGSEPAGTQLDASTQTPQPASSSPTNRLASTDLPAPVSAAYSNAQTTDPRQPAARANLPETKAMPIATAAQPRDPEPPFTLAAEPAAVTVKPALDTRTFPPSPAAPTLEPSQAAEVAAISTTVDAPKSSRPVLTPIEETIRDSKSPVASSPPSTKETETRSVADRTASATNAPAVEQAGLQDHLLPVQTNEVGGSNQPIEMKAAEIKTDAAPDQISRTQAAEKTVPSADTRETDAPTTIPSSDAAGSIPEVKIQPRFDIPDIASAIEASASQPALNPTPKPVEFHRSDPVTETRLHNAPESMPVPQSAVEPVEGNESDDAAGSTQIQPGEATVISRDRREAGNVNPQVDLQAETSVIPPPRVTPEDPSGTTIQDVESAGVDMGQPAKPGVVSFVQPGEVVADVEMTGKPGPSARQVIPIVSRLEETAPSHAARPETTVVNSARPAPGAEIITGTVQEKLEGEPVAARFTESQKRIRDTEARPISTTMDTASVSVEPGKAALQTAGAGSSNPVPAETVQVEAPKQNVVAEVKAPGKQSTVSMAINDDVEPLADFSVPVGTPNDIEEPTAPRKDSPAAESSDLRHSTTDGDDRVPVETKTSAPSSVEVETDPDVPQIVGGVSTVDEGEMAAQTDHQAVSTRTQAVNRAAAEIKISEGQPTAETVSVQAPVEPGKVTGESAKVATQTDGTTLPVAELQTASPSVAAMDAGIEPERILQEPAIQVEANQAAQIRPILEFPRAQKPADSKVNSEAASVNAEDMPQTQPPVDSKVNSGMRSENAPAAEASRLEFPASVSRLEAARWKAESDERTIAFPAAVPADETELRSIEPQVVEEQVGVDAKLTAPQQDETEAAVGGVKTTTAPSQPEFEPVEKVEAKSVEAAEAANNKGEVSASPVGKLDHGREARVKRSETVDRETNVSVPPVGEKQTPVTSQEGVSMKAKPEMEEAEVEPVASTEETARPLEKESRAGRMPGVAAATIGAGKDARVETGGKTPAFSQVNIPAAEVVQQVIRQLNGRLKSGPASMRLQLNPKELGAIEVEMTSGPQGVQVTFFAEQAGTGRLLEAGLNHLRDSLADSGVQLSGLNISQHNSSGQKGGDFDQETVLARRPEREAMPAETRQETVRAERVIGQAGEVDYRI